MSNNIVFRAEQIFFYDTTKQIAPVLEGNKYKLYVGSYNMGRHGILDMYSVAILNDQREAVQRLFCATLNGQPITIECRESQPVTPKGGFDLALSADQQSVAFQAMGLIGGGNLPGRAAREADRKSEETVFMRVYLAQAPSVATIKVTPGLSVDRYKTTLELALAARQGAQKEATPGLYTNGSQYKIYYIRARNFIAAFKDTKHLKEEGEYRQITNLVLFKNVTIARDVLEVVLSLFNSSSLDNLDALKAIGDVFDNCQIDIDEEYLLPDMDRNKALTAIVSRWLTLFKLYKSSTDHKQFIPYLDVMSKVMKSISHPKSKLHIEMDHDLHQELYDSFEFLAKKSKDEDVLVAAGAAKQALLLIQTDKSPEEQALYKVMYAVKALEKLSTVVTDFSLVTPLQETVKAVKKVMQAEDAPAPWFPHYLKLEALTKLPCGWTLFSQTLQSDEIGRLSHEHKKALIQHLFLAVGVVIPASRKSVHVLNGDNSRYTQAIDLLVAMFVPPKTESPWKHFSKAIKDLVVKHQSEVVDLLKELHRSALSTNASIHKHAYQALKDLKSHADKSTQDTKAGKSKDAKEEPPLIGTALFESAGIADLEALKTHHMETIDAIEAPSNVIWNAAKNMEIGVYAKIQAAMDWIADPVLNKQATHDLAAYIPMTGSNNPNYSKPFSVLQFIRTRISNAFAEVNFEEVSKGGAKSKKRAMFIAGENSAGKSSFCTAVEKETASAYLPKVTPFVVKIPLKWFSDKPINQETLLQFLALPPYNLTRDDVAEIIEEGLPVVFLLDGMDEMGKKCNPVIVLGLQRFNCYVCTTFRVGSKTKPHERNNDCALPKKGTTIPDPYSVEGVYATPFTDTDFFKFFHKFASKHPDAPRHNDYPEWTGEKYEAEIREVMKTMPEFPRIFSRPSHAVSVALEFPKIYTDNGSSVSNLTPYKFLKAGVEAMIARGYAKLLASPDDALCQQALQEGNFDTTVINHGQKVAARMYAEEIVAVDYRKAAKAEPAHAWEDYLAEDVYRDAFNYFYDGTLISFDSVEKQELFFCGQLFDVIAERKHMKGSTIDFSPISNLFLRKFTAVADKDKLSFFVEQNKENGKFVIELNKFLGEGVKDALEQYKKDHSDAIMKPAYTPCAKLDYDIGIANILLILEAIKPTAATGEQKSPTAEEVDPAFEYSEDDLCYV